MPALFVFLLKVNIALLLFCAGYYLVLRRLTFYNLNRVYLLCAILFASIYPRINLDDFAGNHRQLVQPIQTVISRMQAPAETLVKPINRSDYWQWVQAVFLTGAGLLTIRLLLQMTSLYRMYRRSSPGEINGYAVRIINGKKGPFSFWRNIYVNPTRHRSGDLLPILQHEQIHADQLHTLDILLIELSIIFYWYSPGIWLMRKAVHENIEFITDQKILERGTNSKQYQYSLLNVSLAATPYSIVSHFNLSTLKKRILMMNAKRSSWLNLTRYALLIPVLLIVLCAFTFSKTNPFSLAKGTYHFVSSATTKARNLKTAKSVLIAGKAVKQNDTTPRNALTISPDTTAVRIQQTADTAKSGQTIKGSYLATNVVSYAATVTPGNGEIKHDSTIKIRAFRVATAVKDSLAHQSQGDKSDMSGSPVVKKGENTVTPTRRGGGFSGAGMGGVGGLRVSPAPTSNEIKPANQ